MVEIAGASGSVNTATKVTVLHIAFRSEWAGKCCLLLAHCRPSALLCCHSLDLPPCGPRCFAVEPGEGTTGDLSDNGTRKRKGCARVLAALGTALDREAPSSLSRAADARSQGKRSPTGHPFRKSSKCQQLDSTKALYGFVAQSDN